MVDESGQHVADLIASQFKFLADDYHMESRIVDGQRVHYANKAVFVDVWQDPNSYELGLALGRGERVDERRLPYHMSELVSVSDYAAGRRYRLFSATSSPSIERGLRRLAEDLQRFGARALAADSSFYDLLERVRERAAREFGESLNRRQIRLAADAAWRSRDYGKVVELYRQLDQDLTKSEQRRLSYARKRSNP